MTRNFSAMLDGTCDILCDECGAVVTQHRHYGAIEFNEVEWRLAATKKKCAEHACGPRQPVGLRRIAEQQRKKSRKSKKSRKTLDAGGKAFTECKGHRGLVVTREGIDFQVPKGQTWVCYGGCNFPTRTDLERDA